MSQSLLLRKGINNNENDNNNDNDYDEDRRRRQNHLLAVPYRHISFATAILPLSALIFCLSYSYIYHFEFSTTTHCEVPNFAPSISSSIGILRPQRHIWKICLAIHSAPRLLTAAVYYKYLNWGTENTRSTVVSVTVVTNVLENISLLMLSFAPSAGEDALLHRTSFGVFLFCSALYMALSHRLFQSRFWRKPKNSFELKSFRLKRRLQFSNYVCIATAMYLFYRHNTYCEPGVYSLFSMSEYAIVVTNIGYHLTSYYDFHNLVLRV